MDEIREEQQEAEQEILQLNSEIAPYRAQRMAKDEFISMLREMFGPLLQNQSIAVEPDSHIAHLVSQTPKGLTLSQESKKLLEFYQFLK